MSGLIGRTNVRISGENQWTSGKGQSENQLWDQVKTSGKDFCED